jgi:hypothetical protein
MRKSRYDEAESGEFKLDACEVFFRYRVQVLFVFLKFLDVFDEMCVGVKGRWKMRRVVV